MVDRCSSVVRMSRGRTSGMPLWRGPPFGIEMSKFHAETAAAEVRYIPLMGDRGRTSPALDLLDRIKGSGLDTSNGAEFIQERLALFARIIALISLTFL